MATIRKPRERKSGSIKANVTDAVKLYRANGANLMRAANRREQNQATKDLVDSRTHEQRRIELNLTMVGLEALVLRLREEREVVEKIYRRKLAHLEWSSLATRRQRLRRIIDGMAAEADIELGR